MSCRINSSALSSVAHKCLINRCDLRVHYFLKFLLLSKFYDVQSSWICPILPIKNVLIITVNNYYKWFFVHFYFIMCYFKKLSLNESDLIKARVHAYATRKFNPMPQDILLNGNAESASVGSHHYEMPCHDFEDLWENLVYDDNIKHDVMCFMEL